MKEYKQIPTRIKVVKSKIQTDYWPQHKSSWISGWIDFNNFNGVHCSHATYTLDLEVGSHYISFSSLFKSRKTEEKI